VTVHALFFCLRPDPATAARLAAVHDGLRATFGLRASAPRTERLHITLHHLGWYDDATDEGRLAMADVRERAERAADGLRRPPLRVDFDEALSFLRKPRNRPLVLGGDTGLDAVRALRAALGERLRAEGLAVDPHFTPHLTLAYDDLAVPPHECRVPGWDATDFHLMDSLQGQSRHEVLGRWPLGG
jgi:RNA 2',3'-cyclic 3'-phosphodiesterase